MDDGKGKPSNIPKKTKLILGVVTLAAMGGGYWWLNEPNIEPEINPNPTEFFTIQGEFPFDMGYKLAVSTAYESSNPAIQSAEQRLMFSALFRRQPGIVCEKLIQRLYATKINLMDLRQQYIRINICLGTADGR